MDLRTPTEEVAGVLRQCQYQRQRNGLAQSHARRECVHEIGSSRPKADCDRLDDDHAPLTQSCKRNAMLQQFAAHDGLGRV